MEPTALLARVRRGASLSSVLLACAATLPLTACSGGGGGGGGATSVVVPVTVATMADQWNLEREGICDGTTSELDAYPLEIRDNSGVLEVRLRDGDKVFAFPVWVDGRTLRLNGSAQWGSETWTMVSSGLVVSLDGNTIEGELEYTRSSDGCTVIDQVRAYRQDGTGAVPFVGRWSVKTIVQTPPAAPSCDGFGIANQSTYLISPRRQGAYSLWDLERELRFDLAAQGDQLVVSGQSFELDGLHTPLESTDLVFDAATQSIDGFLDTVVASASSTCYRRLAFAADRPETGYRYVPILKDVEGTQRIFVMGLVGSKIIDTGVTLDSNALRFAPELLPQFAGVADEMATEGQALGVRRRPSSMYFAREGSLWSMDLRVRTDGTDELLPVVRDLGIPVADLPGIRVESVDGFQEAVVAYRRPDGVFDTIFVNEDGSIVEGFDQNLGLEPIGSTVDLGTGTIDATLMLNPVSKRLHRVGNFVNQLLLLGADEILQTSNSSVFSQDANSTQVSFYDATDKTTVSLGFFDGPIGAVDANDLYFMTRYQGSSTQIQVVRRKADGSYEAMTTPISHSAGDQVFDDAAIVVTENRVVFQYADTPGNNYILVVPKANLFSTPLLLVSFPAPFDLASQVVAVMDDTIFMERPGEDSVFAIDVIGFQTREIANTRYLAEVGPVQPGPDDRYDPEVLVFLEDGVKLRHLQAGFDATDPAGEMYDYFTMFESEEPQVVMHGNMLVGAPTSTLPGVGGTSIFLYQAEVGAIWTPSAFHDDQLDLPIR